MGLITEFDGSIEGYEAVRLPLAGDGEGPAGRGAVLRRRSARPSKRAALYVHCLDDDFVPADLVAWFTERGLHFYAADLRAVAAGPPDAPELTRAAGELGECFACLDAAAAHLRESDSIDTVVVGAHGVGAVVAALWCHARRGSRPADALILASPELGGRASWRGRHRGARDDSARRASAMLSGAQRRIRRGLDIACPVLVMCPDGDGQGGIGQGGTGGGSRQPGGGPRWPWRPSHGGPPRLGAHVTWLNLEGGLPGQPFPAGAERGLFFDELSRWLGAYLSGQFRDQLL